ncbi:hypothetical protein TNCT_449181, partial [Trichonephila clavata]
MKQICLILIRSLLMGSDPLDSTLKAAAAAIYCHFCYTEILSKTLEDPK